MKAKFITFVRGLKNGTPPRFQSYLKSLTLLLGLVLSVNLMADVAPVNTVLWSETWTGASTGTSGNDNYTPSANYGKGTTVYNGGSVSYAQSANTVYVRNEDLAKGTKPELMLSSGKTWTISNISTCGAIELSLAYKSNNTKSSVTCSTSGVKIEGSSTSYTIKSTTEGGALPEKITIVFGCSSNTRIDDVELKVTKAASSKTPLTTPTGLTVGTTTSTSANVSWTAGDATNTGSYKVEYKTSSASTWTAVSPNPTTASCTITGLTPSTTYNWRVTAIPSASAAATKDNSEAASGTNFTTEAPASHDIFWYANGKQFAQYNQQEGADLIIPADPDPATYCDGKAFVGWTANQTYSHETAAPGDLFTSKDSKTVGSITAYYAVFADKSLSETETQKKPTFALTNYSSLPKGWTTTATEGTTYLKMTTGQYVQNMDLKTAGILADSEVLSSAMSVVVSCGTFGTWSGDKKVTVKVDLLDASSNVLTTNNTTFLISSGSEGTDRDAISVDLPTDPTQFAGIKITVSDFVTGTTLRFKNVKLTYNVKTISYSNYTTTCAPTYEATVADGILNGSVLISKTDDAAAGAASLTGLKQGDKVYIFPTANTGYKLDAVTVNETPISAQSGKYSYTIGEAGITVSATFAPATYQITYDLDGGAWVDESQVAKTYTYGTGATLPTEDDVIKANNTFLGWFLNNTGEEATSEIGATETGDKSFTARWLASGSKNVTINGDDMLTYTTFKPTTVDKDAESLEIEYSIKKGYTLVTVIVRMGDKELTDGEVEFSDSKLTITPADGFTDDVAIQFMVAEKMFTVTWMANKTQFKQEQIQEGSKVSLPAETPSDVDGDDGTYKFQGWFTEEQYSNETTAPAYITNNTIEPEGDVTYYAVYAIVTPGPVSNDYAKITATTDLVENGQYIIASSTKALNSDVYNEHYMTATGVTISNNKITNTNTKLVWTIEDVNGGNVLFKSNGNGNYLQIIQDGTYRNLIAKNNDATNANKSYFTPSVNSGNWTLEANSVEGYYVGYKAGSGYTEFTAVTPSSNLQLYKRQNNPDTYKNYRTRVAIIDHIEVSGTPKETNFVAGETFDATGLSIDVHYQGEDNPTNVTEGFTFAPTGALTTENNKITFTYQGKTADVAISVSNTVSKIEVTTDHTKMEYTEGEQFNPAGMVVTATYDNKAERDVTGYTYTPTGDLALGDKITVSFGGQTKDLAITINPAAKTTVNWYVNGVKLPEGEQSTAVIPGKKITALPSEPAACQGNQFVGWTAVDANYYNATTAPTDLFKTLAEVPTIGETETNFYAVFASEAVGTYDEKVTLTSLTEPTADKFTYAFAKNSGTQPSWVESASEARAYVNNTLTVTSKNNRIITKIEYTYNINSGKSGPPSGATVTGNNSDNGSWDATNKTWTSSTNAATTVTLTVNGSAGNYGFTAIKVYLTGGTVLSDYSTTCLAALANPTITTPEGEYCGSVDVVITQPAGNPQGAKIMYSTDNETWNEYTAAVNITTSGTVYAKVVKDPKETDVVSATYTVYPAYNLAQAATAATATSQIACLTFTDLLVQARSQNEAFLKASDGQIVLLNKSSHGLQVGDKLVADNAHLNFIKSHDLLQLTSMDGIEKNGTGTPVADEKTITEITSANYGQLVKIMNVTYDATNKKFKDASSNEIAVDAKFFVSGSLPSSWPDGGKFNATGVVVLDNNSNAVIAPRNTDDLESLATPLDAPTDFVVTSVNSYRASYSWTTVDNNVGYTLYIYDGATEIYKSNKIGSTIETYAPQKDLEAGHTYTAKLVALGDKAEYSDSPAAEVEFTTNPNAKLNWYVGGSFYQSTDASQEKVVTPEDPESPCATNYENFVTWYTEEIVSETGQITALDAAKKVKAGDAAASATTEQVYNFYAVFGKVKTPGTDKYVAVTSEPTKWEGEYLIVHNDSVFNGSLTSLDVANNGVVLTREEDGSYLASNANDYRFTISKSKTEGDYYIQSASGYYIANTTNENKLSSDNKNGLDNIISWVDGKVEIKSDANANVYTFLTFNTASNQLRFRYMKSDYKNLILYKRTKTNPQYSGYITTCPQTYTITIANNTKGLVDAATTTEILKGAKVLLTATAYDGYTKTGGAWVVKNTNTEDVVEGLVGATNYLTMPDYDVTVDYNFQEKKDQFVDNLHGNTTIEKGGANYELPTLSDFSETTGAPSDAFKKFIGWSATSYDSGEPATEKPAILEGNQTATGATYFAVWSNGSGKYITEYCQTAVPTNLHLVEEYHKATSVRIDWNSVDDADKYHIIVMDDETNIIADADVTESLYDLSGLTPGATYICTVKAHKDCWSDETEEFEFTTKENIQSYAVTINAEGGTYTIDPELEDGKIQEGATVTITNIAPTDADHYFFKELTVPEATDLTEITGGYKFTMPGKAVTINIVFAEYPTVTWKMEGAADQTSIAVRNGDKFEVGTVKEAPADWKYKTYFPEFAGWVTSDKCDADGNVTTAEFITATTEVPATGLTVYGAVAKSSAPDCSTATKITSNENLDMSALYVIGAEFSEKTLFYNSIDGTWGKTTQEVPDKTPIVFTISGTKDAIALLGSDGNYIKGCTTKSFAISTDKQEVMIAEGGNIIFGTTTWYLQYNYNSGAGGLRWYSSTSNPFAYLYKVALAYENLTIDPQPDHVRTGLTYDQAGTICLPYAVKADDYKGASVWSIESREGAGTLITAIKLVQEVEEDGITKKDLVAGKPYIFFAEESEFALFYSGDEYTDNESVWANGLIGNLDVNNIVINGGGYQPGSYLISQNKLLECGTNCQVPQYRAYVEAEKIGVEPVQAPIMAPRRYIGNPSGTPTNLNDLKGNNKAQKALIDGHIYILRDNKMYNAQGLFVK